MGVHRLISVYLALVALAVGVQFMVFPLYAYDADGEVMASALDLWHVLGWFMAAGLVLMLVTTCRQKCRYAGDTSADIRPWLRSNVMFYTTVFPSAGLRAEMVRVHMERQQQLDNLASDRHHPSRHVRR